MVEHDITRSEQASERDEQAEVMTEDRANHIRVLRLLRHLKGFVEEVVGEETMAWIDAELEKGPEHPCPDPPNR